MKKIFLLLLLCSGLFADKYCDLAKSNVNKTMELMIIDVKNNDKLSLQMNFSVFKVWVNDGAMVCQGKDYKDVLDTKEEVTKSVSGFLNER